jgi:hypothetical protein
MARHGMEWNLGSFLTFCCLWTPKHTCSTQAASRHHDLVLLVDWRFGPVYSLYNAICESGVQKPKQQQQQKNNEKMINQSHRKRRRTNRKQQQHYLCRNNDRHRRTGIHIHIGSDPLMMTVPTQDYLKRYS